MPRAADQMEKHIIGVPGHTYVDRGTRMSSALLVQKMVGLYLLFYVTADYISAILGADPEKFSRGVRTFDLKIK